MQATTITKSLHNTFYRKLRLRAAENTHTHDLFVKDGVR